MRRATSNNLIGSAISLGFNSRPPCDGRHYMHPKSQNEFLFQFTPAMRRATNNFLLSSQVTVVSIHARHATGDFSYPLNINYLSCFNSRPPCDGRRTPQKQSQRLRKFQFTPAMRRATQSPQHTQMAQQFQFTPAMRRATWPANRTPSRSRFQFTPAMRRATFGNSLIFRSDEFQFTPAMRRATSNSMPI